VEDRIDAGLYLEMTDLAASAYWAERVPAVTATGAGVGRAFVGTNACLGRTDLPRKIDEFETLGLFEVGPEFRSGPLPGLHFVRTSRPGQGVLTGEPTTGLLLVLVSPRTPDQAQTLRDWADFVHIRHIAAAAVPGYGMITPFEHAEGGDPRFLHLYEIHGPDPEKAFQGMVPLVIDRIGEPGTEGFDQWARHPALRIMYVNTFRLAASPERGGLAASPEGGGLAASPAGAGLAASPGGA